MQSHDEAVHSKDQVPLSPGQRRASTASAAKSWLGSEIGRIASSERVGMTGNSINEATALLEEGPRGTDGHPADDDIIDALKLTEENGVVQTTWRTEARVLASYSRPLIITFLLQYSIPLVSVVTVGHLGKAELGAVSISSMTANLTGVALIEGLSTSLDTLCSQAYGSGRKKLVGLQCQRLVYFLFLVSIPVTIIFLYATEILSLVVPDPTTVSLAALYLKILIPSLPGYAMFAAGKRFVQAQGLFHANMYVLLICGPLNALMHWLFVWKLQWGFVGAPTAVVITETLMPLLLFLYVRFVNGMDCWGGLSKEAFRNWTPMIRLAIPGLAMVLAEMLAFEILALSASWISTTHLAAQAVLNTLATVAFQLPYSVSIAASTRIANLVGANLPGCAKVSLKIALFAACLVGSINMCFLGLLRYKIPQLFTDDENVSYLIVGVIPLVAAFQLVDAIASTCSGLLRGLGKQSVGGWVNIIAYYGIAIPISFFAGFQLDWKLYGLWSGAAVALTIVSLVEGVYLSRVNWQMVVRDAEKRNALG